MQSLPFFPENNEIANSSQKSALWFLSWTFPAVVNMLRLKTFIEIHIHVRNSNWILNLNFNWNWNHVRIKHIMLAKRKAQTNQQANAVIPTKYRINAITTEFRCSMCILWLAVKNFYWFHHNVVFSECAILYDLRPLLVWRLIAKKERKSTLKMRYITIQWVKSTKQSNLIKP